MEILRNFVERRVRTTLTIVGVVVGVLALTLTGALAEHFDAQTAGGVLYYRSSIQVADSDRWLRQAIDLIVAGLEATLNEQEERAGD